MKCITLHAKTHVLWETEIKQQFTRKTKKKKSQHLCVSTFLRTWNCNRTILCFQFTHTCWIVWTQTYINFSLKRSEFNSVWHKSTFIWFRVEGGAVDKAVPQWTSYAYHLSITVLTRSQTTEYQLRYPAWLKPERAREEFIQKSHRWPANAVKWQH